MLGLRTTRQVPADPNVEASTQRRARVTEAVGILLGVEDVQRTSVSGDVSPDPAAEAQIEGTETGRSYVCLDER